MTTDTVGGVWTYSLELCRELARYDVQVHLVALGAWPSPSQQVEAENMPNVLLYKSDYRLEWMKDSWNDVEQSRKWINSIYHTVRPDVVHFNNYAHVEKDWKAPVVTVFHSCVQTWWQAVKGKSAPHEWDQYAYTVKASLEASDMVVAPTYAILEKAKDAHQFSSKSMVINNGRRFHDPSGAKKEEFILCMGRMWDEGKNLKLLSNIAQKLPWPVYIAGEQINPDTGKKCTAENVHFLGKLKPEEVQDWMQRASLFVSPTRYEPFGLAILEAAQNGCALVLSELDTLKELWNEAALFFDPEDEVDAEKMALRLLENPEFLKVLSEKARARASFFSSEKMGKRYLQLYRDILKKEHKPVRA